MDQGSSLIADFSPAQEATFFQIVKEVLAERGLAHVDEHGIARLRRHDGTEQSYGLGNLGQMCALRAEEEWRDLIQDHFAKGRAFEDAGHYTTVPNFATAAKRIGVRILPEDEVFDSTLLYPAAIPGLTAYLALDHDEAVQSLVDSNAEQWGVPEEELCRLALSNLPHLAPAEVDRWETAAGTIMILGGESFFTASHILRLQELGWTSPHGTLAIIPNRHLLIVYPILDARVNQVFGLLHGIAQKEYAKGPGSITPNLYWYSEGRFLHCPIELVDGTLSVCPPAELLEVLRRLDE